VTGLDAVEARVVGSLIEKQLTTPGQYPLTANALVLACNQSSNREPVASYSEDEVLAALDRLRQRRLVRFVLPSHGRSVVRYRHVLDELLGVGEPELALLAVLLLRGRQTVGELRARTERMTELSGLEEVERHLERMAEGEEPLVARLGRRPGQKEERWTELLWRTASTGDEETGTPAPVTELGATGTLTGGLPAEVAELRAEVAELRAAVDELRSSLGG
jgi:uncharacterized protein YceH (UPF0502 family)